MNLVRRVQSLEERPLLPVVTPQPVPVEKPADVLAVVEEQVNALRADTSADPAEKARTLGFLSSVALRAMEARDLHARLEAMERVLKMRKADADDAQKRSKRGW